MLLCLGTIIHTQAAICTYQQGQKKKVQPVSGITWKNGPPHGCCCMVPVQRWQAGRTGCDTSGRQCFDRRACDGHACRSTSDARGTFLKCTSRIWLRPATSGLGTTTCLPRAGARFRFLGPN